MHVAKVGVRTCILCEKIIPSGEGVRHPNDRHYTVHKSCGIQKHGKKLIDDWVHYWQVKQSKKDKRWLEHVAFIAGLSSILDPKGKEVVCSWCGLGIEMATPWEHKQITGHPAVIGKDKWAFSFYADSTARWVEIPWKLLARWRWRYDIYWRWRYDIWPWVKLSTVGAVLFALWGFICIHLEPVIDIDHTLWWKIHELHASFFFSEYDFDWGSFFAFWSVRVLVFAFNAAWFAFWTWMFLRHEKLKALMKDLAEQCHVA